MKLKRVLSFGAAAALAVCLSVPVMAESTPGEQIANVTEKPGATMEEVGTAVAAMTSVYQNSQEAVEILPVLRIRRCVTSTWPKKNMPRAILLSWQRARVWALPGVAVRAQV